MAEEDITTRSTEDETENDDVIYGSDSPHTVDSYHEQLAELCQRRSRFYRFLYALEDPFLDDRMELNFLWWYRLQNLKTIESMLQVVSIPGQISYNMSYFKMLAIKPVVGLTMICANMIYLAMVYGGSRVFSDRYLPSSQHSKLFIANLTQHTVEANCILRPLGPEA